MADFATCQRELLIGLRARIPLIWIQTLEPPRALELLHAVARWVDGPIYYHARAQPRLLARHHVTLVLTDVSDVRRLGRLVRAAHEHDGVICVITPRALPGALQRLGMALSLDPPNGDEMVAIVERVLAQYRGSVRIEWGTAEIAQAGALLAGFTRGEAETQVLRLIGSGSVGRSDVARLVAAREARVCERSGLERMAWHALVPARADLGDLVPAWADPDGSPWPRRMPRDGWPWPPGRPLDGWRSRRGRLLDGSWSLRGLPVYRLRLGTLERWRVMDREAALAAALAGAERLAPCVLWLEQADLLNGRRGRPLLSRLLVWLGQSAAGGVVCVGTADDLSLVPAALVRSGRCRLAQPPAGQGPMDATRPVPAGL